MSDVSVRVLGPVELAGPSGPVSVTGAKARQALTLLALHAPDQVSVDQIVEHLWTDPPPSAVKTVQAHVSRLRGVLAAAGAPDALAGTGTGYRLDVGDGLDVTRVERLTRWGHDAHAADAAALLEELDVGPATVVGLSSGGVIALAMAARHGDNVERVVAWEPPAVGVLPGGAEASAALMEPVDAHLMAHPGDFVGAQAILLSAILGVPVSVDDPAFAPARANAETMVRDDPAIPLATFTGAELAGRDITVAVGSEPNELVAGAAAMLAELTGRATTVASGPHEVYLIEPSVLVGVVRGTMS